MKTHASSSLALALLTLAASTLHAQGEPEAFNPETGKVQVGRDLATIDLPEGWSYLQAREARVVVEDYWGNPEDDTVIGLVSPPEVEGSTDSWAIVVSLQDDGHVDDADAASTDFDELLAELQSDGREMAEALEAEGYASSELLGWAEPPHYDSVGKKLYWAKRLQFSDSRSPTLNYDIRILGRESVLVMTAVANDSQLELVSQGCQEILGVTEFAEGKRYEDYDESTDHLAAYGIGGLVAGKLLLKAGLLAKLGIMAAKFWKIGLLAVAGLGALVKRLMFGAKEEEV